MIFPKKLKSGDEVRIIAPSRNANILSSRGIEVAKNRLEELGLKITFGRNIFEERGFHSSSISSRVDDLHEAFNDKNVKGILTVIGGFNSNEILPYIDFELIKQNPKVFCGYSDITALASAITVRTGLVTYSGPHFSSFYMDQSQIYQTALFRKCLMENEEFLVYPSKEWSDDSWFLDQINRRFEKTEWKVFREGSVSGQLYGGNLCTLNLLQGTIYMPNLEGKILFLEDDELTMPETFARDLTSLLQASGKIRGLIIGRFQKASKVNEEKLRHLLNANPLLKEVPVMYDVDFGHTQPMFTFPIGGTIEINTREKQLKLKEF